MFGCPAGWRPQNSCPLFFKGLDMSNSYTSHPLCNTYYVPETLNMCTCLLSFSCSKSWQNAGLGMRACADIKKAEHARTVMEMFCIDRGRLAYLGLSEVGLGDQSLKKLRSQVIWLYGSSTGKTTWGILMLSIFAGVPCYFSEILSWFQLFS